MKERQEDKRKEDEKADHLAGLKPGDAGSDKVGGNADGGAGSENDGAKDEQDSEKDQKDKNACRELVLDNSEHEHLLEPPEP